jgi:Glyoxalase/Bleomycin resistance protein/Dioxygenase superfamily
MFKNVFQIAYVTNDLSRAVSLFQSEQGVAELAIFDDFTLDVEGGRKAVINVALGYVGDTQLEIIEPVSGQVERSWPRCCGTEGVVRGCRP